MVPYELVPYCALWSFASLWNFVFSKADVQMEILVTSPLRIRPLTYITLLLTAREMWISWHSHLQLM